MIVSTEFFLFGGVFLLSSWLLKRWNDRRRGGESRPPLPPSLPCLPLVGSLPFIGGDFKKLHETFFRISNKLGPIFTFKMGTRPCLILNTLEVIREALVTKSQSFSGREGVFFDVYLINPKRKGIIMSNYNDSYKKYHRMSLQILKEFGFGVKNQMESRILEEVVAMREHIDKKNGAAFDPKDVTICASSNVILNMVFSQRRDYECGVSDIFGHLRKGLSFADPELNVAPILRFLPNYRRRIANCMDELGKAVNCIEVEVSRSLADMDRDCFVTRYVAAAGPDYDREQLKFTVRDFVFAGTETVATTMRWLMAELANHPSVQERLQREIDEMISSDRHPSLADQSRLPYVEATILEILRLRTPVPLSVPHLTLSNTEVRGFFIPSGTVVFPNLYAVHMGSNDWDDPETFRPERFLDKDDKVIDKDRVVTFSLGHRSCLGEMLARTELFLFLVGLLQRYSIVPPLSGQPVVVEKMYFGTIIQPSTFEVRMIQRNAGTFVTNTL